MCQWLGGGPWCLHTEVVQCPAGFTLLTEMTLNSISLPVSEGFILLSSSCQSATVCVNAGDCRAGVGNGKSACPIHQLFCPKEM